MMRKAILVAAVLAAACNNNTTTTNPAAGFTVTSSSATPTAGTAVTLTITAVDATGKTFTGYTGTVHVTSDDASAVLPADVTFASADQGTKTAQFTAKKAGGVNVTARDTASSGLTGTAHLNVNPAAASKCTVSGTPAAARAGQPLPVRVAVFDAFNNLATGFTGTVTVTSNDARATPASSSATYTAADAGAHDFSLQLGTVGGQTVNASGGGAITCSTNVTVSAGAASQFAITGLPSNAIAGVANQFTVTATDGFGNTATDFTGTATFSSTDAQATFPDASGSFTNGVGQFHVSFTNLGGQSVTATSGAVKGTGGAVAVHGLVYTPPDVSGPQSLLLVADAASTPALVTLHLTAAVQITGYSAGFNLPADASLASVTGISKGNSLDPGTLPAAMAAALPSSGPMANTLTSGLSQKAAGNGAVTTDTVIAPAQVLYTVTVAPKSAVPGVVFDGTLGGARAAVRDRVGNEVLSQADFAFGKLEVR
jgi:hypothetical protein